MMEPDETLMKRATGEWVTTKEAYTYAQMPRTTWELVTQRLEVVPVRTVPGRGRYGERLWLSADVERVASYWRERHSA